MTGHGLLVIRCNGIWKIRTKLRKEVWNEEGRKRFGKKDG